MPEVWDDDDELVDEDETGEVELEPDELNKMRAAAVLEATGVFIEALQQISEAKGRDDPDDFERAINAIKHMQKIAFNALQLYGFTPRGNLVE